jgi:LDH2 family malate/lactate/ureidoglycolate dehydrogenase
MPKTTFENLVSFSSSLLRSKGFAAEDADFIAEASAVTQAAGIGTHGSVLLGYLCSCLGKQITPGSQPKIVKEKTATALIDGTGTAGSQCLRLALELGRSKARECGCALISVRNTTWIGGLGSYLLPLAREGFLVQLLAQSSACQDSAPVGGIDPCFSTNPMAMAFPTGGDPVVGDFSTSVMSMGKVNNLVSQGQRASQKVFITPAGELTDDPQALLDGGAMLNAGGELDGHKGYTLALWIEALTAMAGGSCNNPERDQHQSFTLIVIDPEAFEGSQYYTTEVQRMCKRTTGGRRREGVQEIRLPGQRMQEQISRSMTDGVEISTQLLESLNALAKTEGLDALQEIN